MRKNKNIVEYPKVSIITCVYNGEKYISKLLDSVLYMGYPNIEHIIVNDGSTDSTEDIVMKYAELYKNKENSNLYIKYIKQENMGLGGATNTGLKQITGEYWTWINCDDWYEPGAFFEPINVLQKKQKIDYIQMNGYYDYPSKKVTIVGERKKSRYTNRKKLFINYCAQNVNYLLFICRTDKYFLINPKKQIYPSKYTQDEQFFCQLFSSLNGELIFAPSWHFVQREDSYGAKISAELNKEYSIIKEKSILALDINEKEKKTFLLLLKEELLSRVLVGRWSVLTKEEILALYKNIMWYRKRVLMSYRCHLNYKIHCYLFVRLLQLSFKRTKMPLL